MRTTRKVLLWTIAVAVATAFAAPTHASVPEPSATAVARLAAPGGEATSAGRPVTIAIVDTGVAPLTDLAADLVPGADLAEGKPGPFDGNGHGTEMASIAAGRAGVCRVCSIMPVRVTGSGGTTTTGILATGVRWAVAHGARVVNVSLSSIRDDPSLDAAIEDAVAAGVVVVVAAGNGGSAVPVYPGAGAPDAITVAGVDRSGGLFSWSSRGSWVQVAAPGQSAALGLEGAFLTVSGTSAAAAYVSGTVGLMLSVNPALTPARVREILSSTGAREPSLDVASGRIVDARAALAAAS